MKEPSPACRPSAPPGGITRLTGTPHAARIDRSTSRQADTEYRGGTGAISGVASRLPGAFRPALAPLPPVGGPEACVIVAQDAETGEELWRRRLVNGPRRARRRDLGRRALRGSRSRGLVNGSQRRPRSESRLWRHVRHPANPEVPAGRHREHAPVTTTRRSPSVLTRRQPLVLERPNDDWNLDHLFERLLVNTAVAPDPPTSSGWGTASRPRTAS